MCTVHVVTVKTLAEQLRVAMLAKKMSVPALLKESGLDCDRTSLQRKLSGDQKLFTEEAEKLAAVLDCTLVFVPEERAS